MVKAGEGKRKERAPELVMRNDVSVTRIPALKVRESMNTVFMGNKVVPRSINRPSSNSLKDIFFYEEEAYMKARRIQTSDIETKLHNN